MEFHLRNGAESSPVESFGGCTVFYRGRLMAKFWMRKTTIKDPRSVYSQAVLFMVYVTCKTRIEHLMFDCTYEVRLVILTELSHGLSEN